MSHFRPSSQADYALCTISAGSTGMEFHPEDTWPRILEDMAQGFEKFPDIIELWLYAGPNTDNAEKLLLWRRS